VVLVDDEDQGFLSRFIWYMGSEITRGGYPCCFVYGKMNTRKQIFMHQLIMAGAYGVDHINRNSLDNRKENLRLVTHQQNGWNVAKKSRLRSGRIPTSKYKGVVLCKRVDGTPYWRVIIKLTKKTEKPARHVRLGPFPTEEAAARAYNAEVVKYRGEYAYLNQIEPSRES
jgi:hypothetical protein